VYLSNTLKPKKLLPKRLSAKEGLNLWPKFDLTKLTWNLWSNHKSNQKYGLTWKLNQKQNQNLKWIKLKKKTEKLKFLIKKESNIEKIKNTKNIHTNSSNMTLQLDQIRWKQEHKHVLNHVRINNLAFIHFDYKRIIMIWSK